MEVNSTPKIPQEAYSFWIHCNSCFNIYVRKERRQFLLACYHISCENCIVMLPAETPGGADSFKCPICSKIVRGRQIGNNMPPYLKEFLHPQPWLKDLCTMRILEFQQLHRKRFAQAMLRTHYSVQRIEKSVELARIAASNKFEEVEQTRLERKRLERRVREIQEQRKKQQEEKMRKQQKTAQRKGQSQRPISSKLMNLDSNILLEDNQYVQSFTQPQLPATYYGQDMPSARGCSYSISPNRAPYSSNRKFTLNADPALSFASKCSNSFIL